MRAPRDGSRFAMPGSTRARRLAVGSFALVVTIFCAARLLDLYPWNDRLFDLWAYWSTRFGLEYSATRPGVSGEYLYSPAFAHLMSPLTALPLPAFAALWTALIAGTLFWLTGWRGLFIGLLAPVALSVAIGQTDILMAAAIVIGFRWPAAWLLPIVTKLTPGIGVLWFAVRHEWRALTISLGATVTVMAVSFAIDPRAWLGWFGMLARMEFPLPGAGVYLPVPVWIRLPLVAILIAWGARSNRRWTLPIAVAFSLPTVWINTPAIMVAIPALIDWGADAPAGRWVRATGTSAEVALQRLRGQLPRAGLALRRDLRWAAAFTGPRRRRAQGAETGDGLVER